jgi:predicted secreted hydrolase
MNVKALLLLVFLPLGAQAQGYAGLGTELTGFADVTRPADLRFPRDHGPHPEFRIEWWYLTATLKDAQGADYGVQWTLFRVATAPEPGPEASDWTSNQIWIGHAGLTTPARHFHAERFARGGVGQAGATAEPFEAWIDDWAMTGRPTTDDSFDALTLTAGDDVFGYALDAEATGPLVRHGDQGYSLKAESGQASYYYSQPFLKITGTLRIEGAGIPVTGTGWIDREWSSQSMSPEQTGWDWFSVHLDGGARLMAYRIRATRGPVRTFGTWATPQGETRALGADEIEMTPLQAAEVAGREIPVEWRLSVPSLGLTVDTDAVNAQSWMGGAFPYWEGPIRVSGSHSGRGYLEMVGY